MYTPGASEPPRTTSSEHFCHSELLRSASPSEAHTEGTRSSAAPQHPRATSAIALARQAPTPTSGARDASGIPGRIRAWSSLRRLRAARGVGVEEGGFGQNFEEAILSMQPVGVVHRTTPSQTPPRDLVISSIYGCWRPQGGTVGGWARVGGEDSSGSHM